MAARKDIATFSSEVELCAAFIAAIGDNWTAYAETEGWDILLVRKADGFQIGVQAKMRLNADVINQASEEYWSAFHGVGPDCRAVLVPDGKTGSLCGISKRLGLVTIVCRPQDENVPTWRRGKAFSPHLPDLGCSIGSHEWPEWFYERRHELPEYVPDVPAGAKAPTQLTRWKISALKIAVLCEVRGGVSRTDFKHFGIDCRRWLPPTGHWMVFESGRFIPGPQWPDFKSQHPRVFEEIKADFDKWAPKHAGALL